MYLKRLELQGFKSFAHRTVFEFTPGVTAVVGPNGSGKSNVADAVRWVLGEHSFRNLRARQGEDLIFAGSQARSRVGMAEASLVFDNSSGWLPIAFSEVSVGRRAHRSGESEYFINNSRVRRRDVIELLAQGGVGASAYTLIAQGLVDEILALHPEERRRVLEEAAGIRIYQDQRDAALAKLQATQENLTRARDILSEITPRLESLRRQAQRAEQYRAAAQELEGLLLTWYGHQWHIHRRALRQAEESAERLESQLSDARQRLAQLNASLEAGRAAAQILGQKISEWQSNRAGLWDSLQEVKKELAVKEERWGLLQGSQTELSQELASLQAREASSENELNGARRRVDELESQWRGLGDVAGLDRAQLEQELIQAQERAFQQATTAADVRVQLAQARDRQEAVMREIADQEHSVAALRPQIAQMEEALRSLAEQRQALNQQLAHIEQDHTKKSAALAASSKRLAELTARREENERALARLEARRAHLHSASGQAQLRPSVPVPGMLGTVAELFEAREPFEQAIQAALGPLAQALVIERWADAQIHLHELKRFTQVILPLDLARPSPRPQPPPDPGVIGLACDLVSCAAGLQSLCESLLGKTLVVQDLESALRLYQNDSIDCDLVTLTGEVLTARGMLHLSVTRDDGGRGDEEQSMAEESAQLEAQREDLLRALEAESHLHREAESSAGALGEQHRAAEQGLRGAERALGEQRHTMERQIQELGWHETIVQRLQVELSALQRTPSDLERRLSQAVEEESTALSQLELLRRRAFDAGRDPSLTSALLEERLRNARSALNALEARREEIGVEIAQRLTRLHTLAHEALTVEDEVTASRAELEKLQAQLGDLDARLGPGQVELTSLTQAGALREQETAELREAIHRREMERAQVMAEIERQKDKLAGLQSQIETDLESVSISLPGATQLPLEGQARLESLPEVPELPPGIDRKVRSLRHTLRRMGGVDPEALAEYQELEARHGFLSSQAEDLQQAMAQLKELIARLDRVMRERFWSSFQAVASEFESYFTNLFKGGSAKLLLTDPRDLTTTGVEIIAQPPGKRRQNVALLSGGEKALTGVALVFALLKTGSSPFCVLDEVDAMLDEVNIRRFHEALLQLAQQVQVIIITHNRMTIEAADTVYGITLGEDSVSRVLSLRLDGQEPYPHSRRERAPARSVRQ